MGALVIGILAGLICYEATQYIKNKLKIDDSLDVFPVHGVGGILGTLLTAVFASSQFGGLGLENSISSQFMIQLFGVIFTIAWCAIFTIVAIKVTETFTGSIRVTNEDEETGIDISDHGESSYN
jgi:Amt family ammonium transporter